MRPEAPPSSYAYWVVFCLMLASAFSFLDRLVLSLLIDPIRAAFRLSDTEVSLLAGVAFASCYVLFAFVFGRWVDRRSRRNAIILGITLWSLATVGCGFATTFWVLFLMRAAVGVGEGSLNPVAYSMIADYFPPARRGLAMAIFACGASVGGGLAILAGGQVVQWAMTAETDLALAPWQMVFVLVGLPGLLVALLIALTVREPARRLTGTEDVEPPSWGDAIAHVRQHARAIGAVFAGFSFIAVNGYAFQVWGPTYFMRLHGLSPAQVGLLFGLGYGVLGTMGVIAGGILSDRLVRRGVIEAPVSVSLWAAIASGLLFVGAYLTRDFRLAAILFCAAIMAASMIGGLQAAMVQSLSPGRMRGLMAALYTTCVTIAGLGIAPTLTAFASDYVFGGPTGIGNALALTTAISVGLSALFILWGRAPARRLAGALAQPISSPPSTGSTTPVT